MRKNDDFFILVKRKKPIAALQMYIRSVVHLPSLMGSDDAFGRFVSYQKRLSKQFSKKRIAFAECYSPELSSVNKSHLEIGCYELENVSIQRFNKYFLENIRNLINQSIQHAMDGATKDVGEYLGKFKGLGDLESAKAEVSTIYRVRTQMMINYNFPRFPKTRRIFG